LQFTKPFQTYEQQADRLLNRGLKGDRNTLIGHFQAVSYYRLSGYFYPLRKPDPAAPGAKLDDFVADASVDQVWDRYVFDRRLRLLAMDALERIEVDARTRLAYLHTEKYGPFGYADNPATLPELSVKDRNKFLMKLRREYTTSGEEFVVHFRTKYGSHHNDLPLWVVCELMTFGSLLTFYRGCEKNIRSQLASRYGVHDTVCLSWLTALNTIRNICAHHARLWNRALGVRPAIPNKIGEWIKPVPIPSGRVFGVLTICHHCLGIIAPKNEWAARLKELLADYPEIPLRQMGFLPDWENHPKWQ